MENQLKELLAKRQAIWAQMKTVGADGFVDQAQRDEYDRLDAEFETNEAEIATTQRYVDRQTALDSSPPSSGVPGAPPAAGPMADSGERYKAVFDRYLRAGMSALDPDERQVMQGRAEQHDGMFEVRGGYSATEKRALSSVVGTAGGFTVPEGFWSTIVEAQKQFGGLRGGPTFKLTTSSGNDIPVPTDNETSAAGAYVAENTAIGEQDVTFGQKSLKAWTVTSKIIRVPIQLLQDSAFDVEAYLARKIGERIGRAEAAMFATGSGVSQPEGLITAATVGATASGTNTLKYADFVSLVHSVDPAYRVGPAVRLVMSDSALRAARLITVSSSDDRPLWQPGLTVGMPNTVLGYEYLVDQGLAAVATGAKPIAFGDLSHFWIRDVAGVQLMRLDERYADYLQVGFLAFARNDSRLIDAGTGPVKVLVMS